MDDPIVNEVRRIRREIEKEFGDDPEKLLAYIYKQQEENREKLVSLPPRKMARNAPSH